MEKIWIVHWDGPFSFEEARKVEHPGYVLYQLSGLHHIYGPNVLLYIGCTEKTVKTRLSDHEAWAEDEYDVINARLGSIGEFESWEQWLELYDEHKKLNAVDKTHPLPFHKKTPEPIEIISKIEKLLIFASAPAYNGSNKTQATSAKDIRVFNTGKLGSLMPEISSKYFVEGNLWNRRIEN